MYSLKVKKDLTTETGVLYMTGHNCMQLSAFEAAYLFHTYPNNFEPADTLTADFVANEENVAHLAQAYERLLGGG